MSREQIEDRTLHRFLPIAWTRTQDLTEGQADGAPPVVKRKADQKEVSRLRKNAFAYDDEHGLGLAAPAGEQGDVLDVRTKLSILRSKSMMQDLGEAMVVDKGAKLGNWFTTDIEKIVTEFAIMNVRGWDHFEDEFLPGEAPIMVGQNPRAASSIGATQHTQMSTACVGKWRFLQLRAPAPPTGRRTYELAEGVRARVELVQVGAEEDSVTLRVETDLLEHAAHPAVAKLLQDARAELMNAFGGRGVDFNVFAAARARAPGAVVTFTPLSNVKPTPADKYVWQNLDTGATSDKLGLPVQTTDFSQGKGNWMVFGQDAWRQSLEEGRSIFRVLYDFTRKPGARGVLVTYLSRCVEGWVDTPGDAVLDPDEPTAHVAADQFWNEGRLDGDFGGTSDVMSPVAVVPAYKKKTSFVSPLQSTPNS